MECIDKRVQELVETYEVENKTKLTKKEIELIRFGFDQAIMDVAWDERKKK